VKITGHTRAFAVLGHPVRHTRSPAFQNAGLQALGEDAVYLAFDVPPEEVLALLQCMATLGFRGANLTIPHKEIACRGMDILSPEAVRAGSVNTVVFHEDGQLEGHSTDGYGLTQSLREAFSMEFAHADVLILGCGGAGRAAALEAAGRGARSILLANRTPSKAMALAAELGETCPDCAIDAAQIWPPSPEQTRACNLLLNATAIGMKPEDGSPLSPGHFTDTQVFLDMVYVTRETPLMKAAAAAGARCANGLGMLLHQGARSLEIWTGKPAPLEVMRRALSAAVYGETQDV